MKLHAIQTGCVRIKPAQVEGRGRGRRRRLSLMTDRDWTRWLPTYSWIIDHPEGVIVVDTGQGVHLLESSRSLHPYHRWLVEFRLEREEEIGPQLRALGVGRLDRCICRRTIPNRPRVLPVAPTYPCRTMSISSKLVRRSNETPIGPGSNKEIDDAGYGVRESR